MTDEELKAIEAGWAAGACYDDDINRLVSALRAAREVLARVDPIHAMGEMCPLCRGIDKHAPDCAVVAVLGRSTKDEGRDPG